MATFLPGVTDTVPNIQPFSPDFGMLQKVLSVKQSRYDQGYAQLQGMYSQLSKTLSNSENSEQRDMYLKQADQKLQKLTTMDLSHPDNVAMAEKVFDPILQDDEIIHDMSITANTYGELRKASSFRDSKDEKVRAQYWSVGEEYSKISLEELSRAKRGDGSIQKVQTRRYVPFVDPIEHLNLEAERVKLGTVESTAQNGYVTVVTNGKRLTAPARAFAEANLNAQHREVIRVQAEVDYNRAFKGKLAQGANESQAKLQLAMEQVPLYTKGLQQSLAAVDKDLLFIDNKIKQLDAYVQTNFAGKVPPAEQAMYAQYLAQKKQLETSQKDLNKNIEEVEVDPSKLISKIQNSGPGYYAQEIKNRMIDQWVYSYAEGKKKEEIGEDKAFWNAKTMLLDYQKLQLDTAKYNFEVGPKFDLERYKTLEELKVAQFNAQTAAVKAATDAANAGTGTGNGKKLPEDVTPLPLGTNPTGVADLGGAYQRFDASKKELSADLVNKQGELAEAILSEDPDYANIGAVVKNIKDKVHNSQGGNTVNPNDPLYTKYISGPKSLYPKGYTGVITYNDLFSKIINRAEEIHDTTDLTTVQSKRWSEIKADIEINKTTLDQLNKEQANFSANVMEDPEFRALAKTVQKDRSGNTTKYGLRSYDEVVSQYAQASRITGYKDDNASGIMGGYGTGGPSYANEPLMRALEPYLDKNNYDALVSRINTKVRQKLPDSHFLKDDLSQATNVLIRDPKQLNKMLPYLFSDTVLRGNLDAGSDSEPTRLAVDFNSLGGNKEKVAQALKDIRASIMIGDNDTRVITSLQGDDPRDQRKVYKIMLDPKIISDLASRYKEDEAMLKVINNLGNLTIKTSDTNIPGAPSAYSALDRKFAAEGAYYSPKSLEKQGSYHISKTSEGYIIKGNVNVFNKDTGKIEPRPIGGLTERRIVIPSSNSFHDVIKEANRIIGVYMDKSLKLQSTVNNQQASVNNWPYISDVKNQQ